MKVISTVSEDIVIAEFLKGEIESERFSASITRELEGSGLSSEIVTLPDATNTHENNLRKGILTAARGYGSRTLLFSGFPTDVAWYFTLISRSEVLNIRYINYSYWVELTAGSRLPSDASKSILEGKEVFGVSNDRFLKAAEAVKQHQRFPPLILAAQDLSAPAIVLEGHLRLTAYAIARDYLPSELEAYVGVSPSIASWDLY